MSNFQRYPLRLLLVALVLTWGIFLSACSDDDPMSDPTRASILVTHDLGGRNEAIKSMTYYCYDRQGMRVYGPASLVKAHQVFLQAVPVNSHSIAITYYDESGQAVGYYSQPIKLKVGEVYDLQEPAWEDMDKISNLLMISIAQDEPRVHIEDSITLYGMAIFRAQDNTLYPQYFSGLCEWTTSAPNILNNKHADESQEGELVYYNANSISEFHALASGTAQVTASFNGLSSTVPVEVTEAVVESVALDVESVTLPATLPRLADSLMATWSDGKVSDVSYESSWSSNEPSVVVPSYGYLIPVAASPEDSEGKLVQATVSANYSCAGETYSAQTLVTVVDSQLQNMRLEVTPALKEVGQLSDLTVWGAYPINGQTQEFELDIDSCSARSTNPDVVAIDDYWELSAKSVGSAQIQVTYTYQEPEEGVEALTAAIDFNIVAAGTSQPTEPTDPSQPTDPGETTDPGGTTEPGGEGGGVTEPVDPPVQGEGGEV